MPGIIQLDAYRDIPQLQVPVTAIVGTQDYVTPAQMIKEFMERLDSPAKNVIEIEGAGHYTFLDDPSAFQKAVIDSLKNRSYE